MDIRKYAQLNDVVVDSDSDAWYIVGYYQDNGKYEPMPKWERIGKKTETAIRNIDKFKESLDDS